MTDEEKKITALQDDFLDSIIADLESYHITDLLSDEFACWCMSNDFIAFNLRNEINSYMSKLKAEDVSNLKELK